MIWEIQMQTDAEYMRHCLRSFLAIFNGFFLNLQIRNSGHTDTGRERDKVGPKSSLLFPQCSLRESTSLRPILWMINGSKIRSL